MYNLGQVPFLDNKWSSGIAYIAIPEDIDRDYFITSCILEGKVYIRTEDGGYYKNCPVSKNIFNEIKWPETWQENGTPVFYITEPKYQQPVILGSFNFNDEIIDLKENGFKIKRENRNRLVQISGDSDNDSELSILVSNTENSLLSIKITSESNEGLMDVDIEGEYKLTAGSSIKNTSRKDIINIVGEDDQNCSTLTQTNTEINARVSKFTINEGKEAMVLGNVLKNFMDDFIDEIGRSTVTTSLGQMPLLNKIQIESFKNKTNDLLSEYGFLD